MNTPNEVLRARAAARLKELAQDDNPVLTADQAQEARSLYECLRALDATDKTQNRRVARGLFGIVVATVVVLGVLWSFRIASADFEADVIANETAFTLVGDRFIELPLTAQAIEMGTSEGESFNIVLPPNLGLESSANASGLRAEGLAKGQALIIDTLHLARGAQVRMTQEGPDLILELKTREPFRLGLTVPPGGRVRLSRGVETEPTARSWPMEVAAPAGQTVTLRLEGSAKLATRPFRISEVLFEQLVDDVGEPVVESTVISGHVRIRTAAGETRDLPSGARVTIDPARPMTASLGSAAPGIKMNLRGQASRFTVDTHGYPEELLPRLLSWLLTSQPVALAWGALLYVISLGAGLLRWRGAL